MTALLRDSETTPPQSNRPNELRQWDLASGKLVPGLRPAAGGVHSVGFTGLDQVASGSEDGVLILQSLGQ